MALLHPQFDFPFHRIGARIGMLAVLVGFVLGARRLGLADLRSLGYGVRRGEFLREAALAGLALGIVLMLAHRRGDAACWDCSTGAARQAMPAGALRQALGLSTAQRAGHRVHRGELPARGHVAGVARESGVRVAVVLTALVFTATHFFASYHIAPEQVTPGSGLLLVTGTLHAFASPLQNADAFVALFAVGRAAGSGAHRHRQHRRLRRAARRLGLGDARDARAGPAAPWCAAWASC